jgi:cytochrome oxidase Cu insertion factor (SCO1/SenC/PrrC family)
MSQSFRFTSLLAAGAILLVAQQPYTYRVPPVTLVDMNSQAVKLAEVLSFKGPVFLQFIFTNCGTVCPVMTATLEAVQKRLGPEARNVRMVAISIDPEEDTPERLRAYAKEFNAGPQWLFLTGTEAASVAAQKAFDVYRGNKMRHVPVTFLRPAGTQTWLRLEGMPGASEVMDVFRKHPSAGQRVYREGILPGGTPVHGQLEDGPELAGARAACANCHRRSGMGSTEGGTLVPAITAEALLQPSQPRQADIFGKLFEQAQPAPFRARITGAALRPAYDDRTLANALRQGIDPTGRKLGSAMPRYRLSDEDATEVIEYLKFLSCNGAPGVDQSGVNFATVISDGADPDVTQSMLDVMNAWIGRRNRETRNELSKQGRNAWYKDDFYRAYREWNLHVWKLEGPRETWSAQLDAFRDRQPVIALIGGAIAGPWKPVSDFCSRTGTPCLFPETLLPDTSPDSGYTLYFSKGLAGEAGALAMYLRARGTAAVTQVYRFAEPAQAFRAAFHGAIHEVPVAPRQALTAAFWKSLKPADALVLWLDGPDLGELKTAMPVYSSANLIGGRHVPNTFLTWPWALPGKPSQDVSRVRGWLLARGVPKRNERVQFNTWFTMALLDYSLSRMVENFSQDYLVETIENEAETSLNPGVFPRLSLGPGQRFASRGAYIVKANGVEPASDWIVP